MRDATSPWVFDASVIINLLGSGIPDRLIEALDGQILVAEQVFREVYADPGKRISPQTWLNRLDRQGLIEIAELSNESLSTYLDLATERLDDGEAATLALAIHRDAVPVIDEKQARRFYLSHYPERPMSSTVELFYRLDQRQCLSEDTLRTALFQALRIAKMRVLPEWVDWVVSVIGVENAKQCSSLPRSQRTGDCNRASSPITNGGRPDEKR